MQQLSTIGTQTYFVRVNLGMSGNTTALEERALAESLLIGLHKKSRIVNRASQVKQCDYSTSSNAALIQEHALFRYAMRNIFGIFPESRIKLDNVVKFFCQARNISEIQVIGYTDVIGAQNDNQRLSEIRADAIRKYLFHQGINPQLIKATGIGAAPIAQGCGNKANQHAQSCNFVVIVCFYWKLRWVAWEWCFHDIKVACFRMFNAKHYCKEK